MILALKLGAIIGIVVLLAFLFSKKDDEIAEPVAEIAEPVAEIAEPVAKPKKPAPKRKPAPKKVKR